MQTQQRWSAHIGRKSAALNAREGLIYPQTFHLQMVRGETSLEPPIATVFPESSIRSLTSKDVVICVRDNLRLSRTHIPTSFDVSERRELSGKTVPSAGWFGDGRCVMECLDSWHGF